VLFFEVITVCLVAVTTALALAHSLEFPGKMRLSRDNYIATQTIYYPGFSIGGFAEPVGVLATLALTFLTPRDSPAFIWTLVAFVAITAMHVVYWLVTHPVNRFWMTGAAAGVAGRLFSFSLMQRSKTGEAKDQWEQLRDTWEHSHMIRTVLAAMSFVSLIVAVAIEGRT
jgi:hypothetical protein